MNAHSAEFWLLLLCGGVFLAGAVRFGAGASRSFGARDYVRLSVAFVRCALGVVALVYLARLDLPGRIGPPFGDIVAAVAFAAPVWLALVGVCRAALLSMPRGWAWGMVVRHIKDTEIKW